MFGNKHYKFNHGKASSDAPSLDSVFGPILSQVLINRCHGERKIGPATKDATFETMRKVYVAMVCAKCNGYDGRIDLGSEIKKGNWTRASSLYEIDMGHWNCVWCEDRWTIMYM